MSQRTLIAWLFALALFGGPGLVHAQQQHAQQQRVPSEIRTTTSAELRAVADEKAALLETIDGLPEDPDQAERVEQVDPVFDRLIDLRTRVHNHFRDAIQAAKAAERPLDKATRVVERHRSTVAVERSRKAQLGASDVWKERVDAAENKLDQSRHELERAQTVLNAYRERVRAYRAHLDFFTDTIVGLLERISEAKRAAFFSLTHRDNWQDAITSLQNGLRAVSETVDARVEQLSAVDATSPETLSTDTLTWIWGLVWRLAVWLILLKLLLPLVPALTDGMLAQRVLRRRATLTLKVAELIRALARPILLFVGVEYLASYAAANFEEFEALVWVIDAVFIYWTITAATKVLALPRAHRRVQGHASAAPFEHLDEDEATAVADLWVVGLADPTNLARAKKLVRSVRAVTLFWLLSAYVPDFVEPITGITVIWWLVDLLAIWGFVGVVYWVLSQWKDDIAAGFGHLAGEGLAGTVGFVNDHKDRLWGVLVIAVASVYVIVKECGIIARRFVQRTHLFKRISAYVFRTKIELQERDRVKNDGGAPIDGLAKLPDNYRAVFEDRPLTDEAYLVKRERYETAVVNSFRAWVGRRRQGSITLVGEPGVGKTTLLERTATLLDDETDLPLIRATIEDRLTHPADVIAFFRELFDLPETVETQAELIAELSAKPEKTPSRVVLLDDCHNAFTRQIEGFDSLETLLDIVNLCDAQHFFVLTFNKFTWNYVNRIDSREHYFGQVLRVEPFSEGELEELIEGRNAYTAFAPSFADLVHDQINDEDYFFEIVKTANGYFRYLHEFSGGNPRIAMVYWLRSLRRRRNDLETLQVSLFQRPPTATFSSYTDNHWFILSALAQHGALSAAEIAEVVNLAHGFCATSPSTISPSEASSSSTTTDAHRLHRCICARCSSNCRTRISYTVRPMLTELTHSGLIGIAQATMSQVTVAQATPEAEALAKTLQLIDFGKVLSAAVIIAVAYALNQFVASTLDRFGEGVARRRMFFKKVSSFARLAIFVGATSLVLTTFLAGQERALIGVMGTVGLAIGFALKDTVSSIMAGILILVDQPFQVGDRVTFGEVYGEVKEIGLRAVRIRTPGDDVVSIPNNTFLTEAVASANAGTLDMMVSMQFYIALTEDFVLAKRLVYEACVTSRYVFLDKPVVMLVEEVARDTAFTTVITCKAYVIDTRFEKDFVTDVTERVKRMFRKHRIQAPYAREYMVKTPESHRSDQETS
jgi:small-conductance mechanosensitive channel/flagellar biosynthesis GTPase FlhF